MDLVIKRNNHEPEFLQAVQEVAETVIPYIVQSRYLSREKYLIKNGRTRKIDFFPSFLGR